MAVRNPRSQVLMASRARSGSVVDDEDAPPTSPPPPPPEEDPPDFLPVYKADSLPRSSKLVGSKVSMMREKFQAANGNAEEHPQQHHKFQPIKSYHHHVARSPPPALLPHGHSTVGSTRAQSVSTSALHRTKEPTSPTSSSNINYPPSSHVQRFNYTRALFARMEEETKKQQEIEKSAHLRKPSPAHGVRSPVVSPTRGISSPTQTGSSSSDEHEVHKRMRLSTDSDEMGTGSISAIGSRRSRADYRPPVPSRKPDTPRPAYSEPNLAKAVSNTPAGLLWKRRQNDILTDISNTDKFHDSKNRTQLSSSSSHVDGKSDSNDTLDNSVFSNSNGSLSEDLSITSAYHSSARKPYFPSDNSKFIQGRSASTEVLNSRSSNDTKRSMSHESKDHEEVEESDKNVDKGGVVTRRTRPEHIATHPGKRLSKEEIQAAIDRADTYLRSTSTSSEESESKEKHLSGEPMIVSDITSNSSGIKPVVPAQKMSQSDSSAQSEEKPDPELKSWALYRKQRYSRTSDYLDDKVSDISKLGSISDTSVSGYRKTSMENLSKPQEPGKTNDPFAAISQSSVLMNRRSAPSLQQKPPSPRSNVQSSLPDNSGNVVSETNIILQTERRDSGSKLTEKHTDLEPEDSSQHSISTTSGVTSNARPIPVPRRTAPPPPNEPPPPPPSTVDYSHSPTCSPAPPSEPPPPAPEPGLAEEIMEEVVTKINQSEALSSIPPVPGFDVQLRNKAHVLSLDEPEESSDSEPRPPVLERAGSRKALIIEQATELPQREDGDGTEHPEIQQEPILPSDHTSLLLHDSLPPPPAYPGHSKLPQYNIEEETSEIEEDDEDDVNYLEIDGLSSTSSESEEEYIDYEAKKDKKIQFSRAPIRVFMTYSTDDYDRRNEDIDPVAASAEYELEKRVERMDVFPVDLDKGPEGLGLSIIGMGVGADAGLEKLGIFIKTLTEGGAAQRSGKMQVNDQIIEVDGKSLVGVTQAYAASVLRNTSGEVKFLIGREKDPSKSEVARLIQQSLEIDRKREELRKQEQDKLKVAQELHDQFKPRDEILEHEHIRHLSEASNKDGRSEDVVNLDESSVEEDVEEREADDSEELMGGEATPLSMPSAADSDTSDSSPEEQEKPVVEVFDLPESSPDDISPDMESQALFVKLKEAQCKNAVLEAEITKLKAKLVVLENNEAQKKQYEKKNEEMASRLREMEKSLTNARKEINHYQDMMEGSQGQYIALEKRLKAEYTALEKKYHKAKKLIKEYQQREKDFIAERESLLQQQSEKDQQYDALVKSLKDRIFHLEGELGEAQKAAGLPVQLPPQDQTHAVETTVVPSVSMAVRSAPKTHDSGSLVVSPLADRDSISSESDISATEPHSSSPAIEAKFKPDSAMSFESVPAPKLLDTSVSKAKAQLAASSPRRPPTKQRSKSQDSEEMIEAISENKPESGLETWIKHDSDNTVKKSDVRKRKAQQNVSNAPPPVSETPPITAEAQPKISEAPPPAVLAPPSFPPPASPPELLDQSDDMETPRDRCNSESGESSSTLSQTSYDPSQPTFRNKDSEIPGLDTGSTGTTDTAETSESSSSATAPNKQSKGLLPKLPFKFGGSGRDKGGGVMLVSQRSIGSDDLAPAGEGGITLISKKKIDTGLDYDGISTTSDASSGYMVGEIDQTSYSFSGTPANEDHPSQPGHHTLNQFSSGQITEWNNENVRHWLIGIEMERYASLFTEKSVTGPQLIAMDTNKLKALGVTNVKDRDYLKKKVKELKLVLEKERKQMEREKKQLEKEQKQREKEQKKMSKKK